MSEPTACLSAEAARQFRARRLPAEESARIEAHVLQCPACAALAAEREASPTAATETAWSAAPLPPNPDRAGPDSTGDADAESPRCLGRYPILGVIGQGGMGIVYRGLDESLHRPLAIKVLLFRHRDNAQLVQRFLREAQIMGQLQHPGVAPVHEIRVLPDGRPCFTMKQIEGHTFAELLRRRRDPHDDLTAHLGVFAQVCQTLAYAHARRIIHRDLKPDNVMVGAFGEVQVMDWGLAKNLGDTTSATTEGMPGAGDFEAEQEGDATAPGTILGTPAYMAPEQARGEVDRVNERSDVFGLGAILCEILTGQPPFGAATTVGRHLQAARAELDDALARLGRSGADTELLDLARRCLAAEPGQRPAHAGAVAETLAAYQVGVRQRMHAAELAQAAAQARAREERKRRRVSVALLALALVFVVAASAAAVWYFEDQARRAEQEARAEAERARLEADRARRETEEATRHKYVNRGVADALDDAARWHKKIYDRLQDPITTAVLLSEPEKEWLAPLERAEKSWRQAALLAGTGEAALDPAARARLEALRGQLQAARRDWELGRALDAIRFLELALAKGVSDRSPPAARYSALFANLGLDVAGGDPRALANDLAGRPLRYVLVAALDHWLEDLPKNSPLVPCLLHTARLADPHPWRDQVRDPVAWQDPDRLQALAAAVDVRLHCPQFLMLLASRLPEAQGARLMRQALVHYSRDFLLHFNLGLATTDAGEKVGCFRTAVALRPESVLTLTNLGVALCARGDFDEGMAVLRQAIARDAGNAMGSINLANAQLRLGDLDGAVATLREALRHKPTSARAHNDLATLLYSRDDDLRGAVYHLRKSIEHGGNNVDVFNNLGTALFKLGELDEALECFTRAVALDGKHGPTRNGLGMALQEKGDLDGAIEQFRQFVAVDPQRLDAYQLLATALLQRGRLQDAIDVLREAVRTFPNEPRFGWELQFAQDVLLLNKRLPGILDGQEPGSPQAARQFAWLCARPFHKRYALALQLYEQAVATVPAIEPGIRFEAACAAALLAAGADAGARVRPGKAALLRGQALRWLQADLDAARKLAQSGQAANHKQARERLASWKRTYQLASVRDGLRRTLPVEERAAWQRFWLEVGELLGVLAAPPGKAGPGPADAENADA
jgi:Tfp pilus assembly protein PilF